MFGPHAHLYFGSLRGGAPRRKRKGSKRSKRRSGGTRKRRRSGRSTSRGSSRKPKRLVKGSRAAKLHMARLRRMRK
jgi:hypothetical protein